MPKVGAFYGVGVGPGDPDLITVKAVKILNQVDLVFTASSSTNEYSLARQIGLRYLKSGIPLQNLPFPMTEDDQALKTAWRKNASDIAEILRSGRSAAFLTLGDCLTYSTYAYLLPILTEIIPEAPITSVPGITSYQQAAARLNRPLVMTKESLSIISGGGDEGQFETLLDQSDNVVIMKMYRGRDKIVETLRQKGLASKTALCAQLDLPGEKIVEGLDQNLAEAATYFSLLLVTKRN
ncbi:MAG: precorrin-2 C(20)-methyltransferase [Deltaproteobacteria bacterium]|jgi:precorrin-2/cobalt-factor-2 C20-methyltransferase|nr:precorrin-2 C(20)-methyltransferase [Deltaproteobacteria bacterium]